MSLIVTSSAVGIFAFRGRLQSLALGLRTPLQACLDVDNWMRQLPSGGTPRARISARYISLLQAIQKEKYTSIVIIAHSQGAIVSADVLRYLKLKQVSSDFVDEAKVYFISAGAPIRQAYGNRFPELYEWATGHGPNPDEFGIKQWVNMYRSGDYIGRNLWDSTIKWKKQPVGKTEDICIGSGAHLHYFDSSTDEGAKLVATKLDEIIGIA